MLVFPKRFPPKIPSALYNDKYILSPSRKIAVLQIMCHFISRRQEISLTEQEKYTLQTVYPLFWFSVCAGKNSNILQPSAAFHVEVNRGCMWRDLTQTKIPDLTGSCFEPFWMYHSINCLKPPLSIECKHNIQQRSGDRISGNAVENWASCSPFLQKWLPHIFFPSMRARNTLVSSSVHSLLLLMVLFL